MLGLLLKEGPEDLFDHCLLSLPLAARRAVACTNHALRTRISRLSTPVLRVSKEDATFENAQFVARLPGLTTLFVEGETTLPNGLEIARLRDVARINCSCVQFETGLFLGVALAAGDHRFRLSSGVCVNLAPLRTRDRLCLASNLTRTDLAVLLGALSLNRGLCELDLSGLLYLDDEEEERGFAQLASVFKAALPTLAGYATSGQISLRGRLYADLTYPTYPTPDSSMGEPRAPFPAHPAPPPAQLASTRLLHAPPLGDAGPHAVWQG